MYNDEQTAKRQMRRRLLRSFFLSAYRCQIAAMTVWRNQTLGCYPLAEAPVIFEIHVYRWIVMILAVASFYWRHILYVWSFMLFHLITFAVSLTTRWNIFRKFNISANFLKYWLQVTVNTAWKVETTIYSFRLNLPWLNSITATANIQFRSSGSDFDLLTPIAMNRLLLDSSLANVAFRMPDLKHGMSCLPSFRS